MREAETLNQDKSDFDSLAVDPLMEKQITTRLFGMKEYDSMMEELKKENFELKVRIYLLEDDRNGKFRCNSREIQTQKEELKKIIHDKETEIIGKEKLLLQRKTQMKQLINQLEIEQARNKTLEQKNFGMKKRLSEKKQLISTLKQKLNMYKQLETKTNVAGIFMLPHDDGDVSSPTGTMSSGSNSRPKNLETELHSKSNQATQAFNETAEYQRSSHHLQLSLHNEQSCLGGDSVSLPESQRGNSAPKITSSLSDFKDRPSQINTNLQQLLEVKTKENFLLHSKLGLSDQVGEIDPTFLPDVNQLKKKVRDLKTELCKSNEMIQKQQTTIHAHCREIERMTQERNACLCGILEGSKEQMSDARDNKNFDNRKSQKEESLLKNETIQNVAENTNSEQRVKYLTDKFISMDMIICQQSKEVDCYKNVFEASALPFKNSPSSKNFTPSIYDGKKFMFDSETEPNFKSQKVLCAENSHWPKIRSSESKDQYLQNLEIKNSLKSEPVMHKSEQQQQSSNKDCSSNHSADIPVRLSHVLAYQCPSYKMNNKTNLPNNNLLNTSSYLPSKLCQKIDPLDNSGFNDHKSEVVTLLKHYLKVIFNVCNQLSDYLVDIEGLLDTCVKEFRPKVMLKKKMNNVHATIQCLQTLLQVDMSP